MVLVAYQFFATAHGKSYADGAAAVMKTALRRLFAQLQHDIVQTAEQLVAWCNENMATPVGLRQGGQQHRAAAAHVKKRVFHCVKRNAGRQVAQKVTE